MKQHRDSGSLTEIVVADVSVGSRPWWSHTTSVFFQITSLWHRSRHHTPNIIFGAHHFCRPAMRVGFVSLQGLMPTVLVLYNTRQSSLPSRGAAFIAAQFVCHWLSGPDSARSNSKQSAIRSSSKYIICSQHLRTLISEQILRSFEPSVACRLIQCPNVFSSFRHQRNLSSPETVRSDAFNPFDFDSQKRRGLDVTVLDSLAWTLIP
jgi:hypothetical protein